MGIVKWKMVSFIVISCVFVCHAKMSADKHLLDTVTKQVMTYWHILHVNNIVVVIGSATNFTNVKNDECLF